MSIDNVKNYISTVRRDFADKPFSEDMASDDPFQQYAVWFQEAIDSQILDPYAACLSTATKDGIVSSITTGSLQEMEDASLALDLLGNIIKRLKEGKNSKTIAAQVFDPKSDGRKTMAGMPCLLSMDFKPRDGELFMTAFFRSQAVSKSGYADYTALVEMGNFICEQTDLILSRVTNIAGSGHIRNQNYEKNNTI